MNTIDLLSTNPLVQRLGWTLIHFLWQGVLLVVLLAAFRGLLGRSLTVHSRYILSCLTLGVMMTAPLFTFISVGANYQSPVAGGTTLFVLPSMAAGTLGPITAGVGPWQTIWQQTFPWVVVVWVLGLMVFSIRFLRGCLLANKLRSVATHPAPSEWREKCDRLAARAGAYPSGAACALYRPAYLEHGAAC